MIVFEIIMKSKDAVLETLNVHSIFTLIFIMGMMKMVEGVAGVGFFRWLCMAIILFLAAITVELSAIVGFNPVPVIMKESIRRPAC